MPSLVNKKTRKIKLAGANRERGVPGYKLVSYCPVCPPVNNVHPQKNAHATVGQNTRQAFCKHGHRWQVV